MDALLLELLDGRHQTLLNAICLSRHHRAATHVGQPPLLRAPKGAPLKWKHLFCWSAWMGAQTKRSVDQTDDKGAGPYERGTGSML